MTDNTQSELANNNARSGASQKSQLTPTQDNPCSLCRAFGTPPPCKGHGGSGGGGSEDGGSSDGKSNNKSEYHYGKIASSVSNIDNAPSAVYLPKNEVNSLTMEWREELISSISIIHLDKGLLNIECDNLHGILTIQTKSGLSEENIEVAKQAKQMIKAEFDLFKEELQEKGIAVHHFTTVVKDASLTIKIPHPKYFSEFIKRLTERNLLPSPKNNEKEITLENKNPTRKLLSPFDISKGPLPKG